MISLISLYDGPQDTSAAVDEIRSDQGVRHAVLNSVISSHDLIPIADGDIPAHALLQLWVEAGEDPRRYANEALGLRCGYAIRRHIVLTPPSELFALKRMPLLERTSGKRQEQFREVWFSKHGPRVAAQAGALLGYCQNHVVRRSLSAPLCDGMTELWFADEASLFEVMAHSSVVSDALAADAGNFIDRITTFLVQEERLK